MLRIRDRLRPGGGFRTRTGFVLISSIDATSESGRAINPRFEASSIEKTVSGGAPGRDTLAMTRKRTQAWPSCIRI
jgi:hypothetical protein